MAHLVTMVAHVWRDIPTVLLAALLGLAFVASGVGNCAADVVDRLDAGERR